MSPCFCNRSAVAAVLAVVVSSCAKDATAPARAPAEGPAISSESLPAREDMAAEASLFSRVDPGQSGIGFSNPLDESHAMARLYFSGFACGGVVMADFNGDTRPDLFFTGGAGESGLFLQNENPLQFTDVTARAGVGGGRAWSSGAVAIDIDADGDQDLLVCNYDAAPHLFINDGAAHFTDHAAECGLTVADAFIMPTVIDYDRDGDVDIFLVAYQLDRAGGRPAEPPVERGPDGKLLVKEEFARYYRLKPKPGGGISMDDSGRPDLLLRNDSDGSGLPRFVNVTEAAGLGQSGFGLSATWFDFNADGWPDLHVGNDFSDPDRLYQNRGNGTFADIAAVAFPHCAWFSMGSDVADVDGDGLDDLFCADMAFTTHYKQKVGMGQMGARQALLEMIQPLQLMRNHLFVNTGSGPFREAGQMAGIAKSDWTWAVKFADLDLDGREDLFVANGSIRSFNHSDHTGAGLARPGMTKWDVWKDTPPRPEPNLAFRNTGDLRFEEVASDWGLDDVGVSHGVASGDLDGDGDPDLVVTSIGAPAVIYRNDSDAPLVCIRLKGTAENPAGIGARVMVEAGGLVQTKTVRPANGYLTTAATDLTFGLGGTGQVTRLQVTWPDGREQEFTGLAAGQRYTIDARSATAPAAKNTPRPLFSPPQVLAGAEHREPPYDDFAKQPLLPHKLSQLGPASAWGDIDGDGDEDFFLGGASTHPGRLLRNDGGGRFSPASSAAFEAATASEDAAAAFFDADGDGDTDLYVASGSYENAPGAPELRDRLYLNDGAGNFAVAAAGALPDVHDVGSCVRPSDVDGDGDLDLFVGSRVTPGQYPLSTASRLLVNNGGVFTESVLELPELGMVTDAVWVDVDSDGRDDLLITAEWGPVKLLKNTASGLVDGTAEAGLGKRTGWWTRAAAHDIDSDGDSDLLVGNFGLNTKYHASADHPALLYYGDLSGDGEPRLIEAEFEGDVLFPVRGKSCSTAAMPGLAGKFSTFHAFAGSALDEIYAPSHIESAQRFECNTLESGILINDGNGAFTFRALPRAVQLAPVQGFAIGDFDGDGVSDLAVAQNFYSPQFETGPYAGGTGVLLKGDGAGEFIPMPPRESGVLLRGDPRGLHAIDVDGNGALDLVCPLNNGPLLWQARNNAAIK